MQPDGVVRTGVWLDGASESCPHCLQLYVYELEYRCSDCDIEVCPFCVADHRSEAHCPDCGPARDRHGLHEVGAADGEGEDDIEDEADEVDEYEAFAGVVAEDEEE